MTITFICCPKPFLPEYKNIQTNAILSWKNLKCCNNIVVVGDEFGIEEFCTENNLINEKNVNRNEWGTPLLDSIFELGYKHSEKYVCYVNSDIIFLEDFDKTFEVIFKLNKDKFLFTGRQWSVKIDYLINFKDNDEVQKLILDVKNYNKQNASCAIDYFLHTKTTFEKILPFAIGRWHWDRWLMYEALRINIMTIDLSDTIMAIHQDAKYYQNNSVISFHNMNTEEINRNRFGLVNCWKTGANIDDSKYKTQFNQTDILIIDKYKR
jgi:hypothetical protein